MSLFSSLSPSYCVKKFVDSFCKVAIFPSVDKIAFRTVLFFSFEKLQSFSFAQILSDAKLGNGRGSLSLSNSG